jgi:hypothetical protein
MASCSSPNDAIRLETGFYTTYSFDGNFCAWVASECTHLTNRSSQPLAVSLPDFEMTSTPPLHISLALASGGSALAR